MWLLVIGELNQLRILWGNCFEVKLQTKSACISNLVLLSNNYAVGFVLRLPVHLQYTKALTLVAEESKYMLLTINLEMNKYFSLCNVKKEINPGELLQNIQQNPSNLRLYNRNYPANSNYTPISL